MKKTQSYARLEIHPYDAVLHFTTTRKAFSRTHAKYIKSEYSPKNSKGVCSASDSGGHISVGVFDGSCATLAHELAHCAFKVLEKSGVPTVEFTSEAFCYLLSNLMERCLPFLGQPR